MKNFICTFLFAFLAIFQLVGQEVPKFNFQSPGQHVWMNDLEPEWFNLPATEPFATIDSATTVSVVSDGSCNVVRKGDFITVSSLDNTITGSEPASWDIGFEQPKITFAVRTGSYESPIDYSNPEIVWATLPHKSPEKTFFYNGQYHSDKSGANRFAIINTGSQYSAKAGYEISDSDINRLPGVEYSYNASRYEVRFAIAEFFDEEKVLCTIEKAFSTNKLPLILVPDPQTGGFILSPVDQDEVYRIILPDSLGKSMTLILSDTVYSTEACLAVIDSVEFIQIKCPAEKVTYDYLSFTDGSLVVKEIPYTIQFIGMGQRLVITSNGDALIFVGDTYKGLAFKSKQLFFKLWQRLH